MCVLSRIFVCAIIRPPLSASAMEIIEKNVELNASSLLAEITPSPLVLDWEDESLPAEVSEGVDLVVYVSIFTRVWWAH